MICIIIYEDFCYSLNMEISTYKLLAYYTLWLSYYPFCTVPNIISSINPSIYPKTEIKISGKLFENNGSKHTTLV